MRRRSAAARAVVTLLTAVPVLAACTHAGVDPATGRSPGTRQPGARQHSDGRGNSGISLADVRAGLRDPASRRPVYYLSLGDSLARGIQPATAGRDVPTSRGYTDQLAARLRGALPHLRLVKLGCSGETTSTMIHGGICRYPAGSQLAQAARFLRSHRGSTALITIDIGANDPNSCVLSGGLSSILPCVVTRMPQIGRNLGTILATLRSAAGPRVLIVGMTYYVPELGLWHRGRTGRQIAILTGAVAAGANQMLVIRYRRYGARVANVFAAFRSSDFGAKNGHAHAGATGRAGGPGDPAGPNPASTAGAGSVPPNVATICSLTWMCARAPRGPNEHPNNAGYRVIAQAYWRAITR
ncbi:MAG TPA: SGNH/GDSL hydrolase family protein [Streptosporangiaceae bacterium]|nr:SGNH/GDSL hydrolase family protein [Streptosporangiaceae bacterium]